MLVKHYFIHAVADRISRAEVYVYSSSPAFYRNDENQQNFGVYQHGVKLPNW